ncbi:L-type lectin-domain containing receptor kinase IX.1-like [Cryptomeria japonica]|uniref:L-type lectin-domain containing receptor kinase IX.1-like n=1 Tax=Cryptomeria japonica TaxID=3369 RepID=UPI0027DA1124|nr:L-type lectin-domain containing receptor kinase IX.1-like [Cryptomeria japonica]
MAKFCQPLDALLSLCFVASFIYSSHAGSLSFEFPPFIDIKTEHDAQYQTDSDGDKMQLTKNEASGRLNNSFGWAVYEKPIPLWDRSSRVLANFSTHFQFIMGINNYDQDSPGEGLAFFLAPFELEQPNNSFGGYLGLFNDTTFTRSFYQMVAVEFDTTRNKWDPDDNHVGIDVNSIVSISTVLLTNFTPNAASCRENVCNGDQWDAWVDYDGGKKMLQVYLWYNSSKPENAVISNYIDLRDFLPENISVGLSASTGNLSGTHTINLWNFSCEYSSEIPAVAPSSEIPAVPPSSEIPSFGPPNKGSSGIRNDKENENSVKATLIWVSCIVVGACGFVFLGWHWNFSKNKLAGQAREESDVELDEWFSHGPRRFSYAELSAATRNFCDDEKLGQGGFGGVYRGILPGTAEAVAVKRIAQGSKQGRKEYVSEVTTISRLRHRNLVQLLGWCHEKGELLLVYEYLPNGSLDKHIFGKDKDTLEWDLRYSIASDIASALVYLHEEWDQRVVHRDVKASNVMLDSNFNGKLGDFGLARLMERDQVASHTTVVAGTRGYLAPECYITGKTSPEADVYSFGAVTLEIACGRRPVDRTLEEHNSRLVEWVWDLYGKGKVLDAADEKLGGNFNAEDMERLMVVGLLCSNLDPTSRPKMKEVIKILKREAELPHVPLDLPVAVYSQRIQRDMSSGLSTSAVITSPGVFEPTLSSSSPAVKASVSSSSTIANSLV